MFDCFGEYVGEVVVCVNIFERDFTRVNVFSKEVVFDVDMFDMLMEGRIL